MSIKSQKSLYEECSEIFEKSYSVRSASEDSLSCDDADEGLARELMNKMTPAVLSKLRRSFKKGRDKTQANDIDRRVEAVMRTAAAQEGIEFKASAPVPPETLWIHKEGFLEALDEIFGNHKYSTHALKLFQLLDPFSTGRVLWRQLICRLVAIGAKKTKSRAEIWTPAKEGRIKRLDHCKRETIVKLVTIERDESFCYVALSRGGRVGVYSAHLKLLHSYEVYYHRTGLHRRVKNCWITDAIYLNDVQCMLLSSSDRSITVYDVSTLCHAPLYCVTGLPHIPTCLAYSPSRTVGGSSELALGTERGDITRLQLLQPRVSLFHTRTPDNINYYFWMELCSPPHTSYCTITTWRRVHSRSIRRLCFIRDGEILLSCSHDSTISLRSRHVPGKLHDYVFRVQRGVTCFHVVPTLHLLVTGSCDGVLRLWEITQPTPFATLRTPGSAPVLDVAVIAAREIVVTYSNDCTVNIWDMYEECLLQSMKIKFPVLGVLGKKIEFGAYCIHAGPIRKSPSDDESMSSTPSAALSRRSSVYQGSTGGLMLESEEKPDTWETRKLTQDREYVRFNRCEVLVSCGDCVCVVELGGARCSSPLPPPGDTLRAATPFSWDLPPHLLFTPEEAQSPPAHSPRASLRAPVMQYLSPADAEHTVHDLDKLLEKAGLLGILEKDFVLMQGLKYDLNNKLAELETNMDTVESAVSMGAPYLALKTFEPRPVQPMDELRDTYKQVMRLFPGPSVVATPTGSDAGSTPRMPRKAKRPTQTTNTL